MSNNSGDQKDQNNQDSSSKQTFEEPTGVGFSSIPIEKDVEPKVFTGEEEF